ncbi:MAG: hydroxymethylbilane synthase [Chloroflexi bacterium]|nr:hydroxymethylbilane synthase [Chloroflexota bacterium]MCH8341855.1 hydroxymethylbilane synthase [Chloroflexota bacterium]MCH8877844.1 hydroxymethylbilane synthase [Chloroflexota bacterium]MCI0772680.1 hydroxymethylbilane synthase [Chloroflexota bacterium]MCI0806271.1 hydroxymethylbilane synthase [Chloroflexota bacterium]
MQQAVIATRPSRLARWQAQAVKDALARRWPGLSFKTVVIKTSGDRTLDQPLPAIGGKGAFTSELEQSLRNRKVDLAVHSLKDLPIENSPDLVLGAVLMREDARDVLISSRGAVLADLPAGASVGTSSPRRQAQILALRPDLLVRSIRGNVETRIRKVREGQYEAAVLAAAGVLRLGLTEHVAEWFSLDQMLPAPGQGALAVQCRAGDEQVLDLLRPLMSKPVQAAVTAERTFLSQLGGGCLLPVGAYADIQEGDIKLIGMVASLDGSEVVRVSGRGLEPRDLGEKLGAEALARGAREILGVE